MRFTKRWFCLATVLFASTLIAHTQAAQQVFVMDGFGLPIGSTSSGGKNYLDVSATLNEAATAANASVGLPALLKIIGGYDGTNVRAVSTDSSGKINVNSVSVGAGPTGAAVPADASYIGANKAGNLTGLLIGQQTMANSLACVLPSDQSSIPVAATLQAGAAIVGKVGIDQTTPGTTNGVQVNAALPAGANVIGKVSIDQTTPGTTNRVAANLDQVGGSAVSLGQKTMANSIPVTMASDQANITTTDLADGSVAPGAAGTKSALAGMIYNSGGVAPTNGQQLALQSDVNGNVLATLPDLLFTGQAAQTATVNNIIPAASSASATSSAGYHSATVQINSTGTGGTYIFEGSEDNTNFVTIPVWNQLILTGTPITAAITASSSTIVYTFPVTTAFIRVRIATTITGGSIQAFTKLSQIPFNPGVQQVAQATAANLNVTATLAAGAALAGKVGIDQTTVGTTNGVSLAQIGATTVVTGTGASTAGSQRVTVANDSQVKLWDGTTNTTVKASSTAPATTDTSLVVAINPNSIAPKTYANSSGSFVLNSTLTTVVSETCPANSVGYILEASSANTNSIRWALGATATTSSGMRLEAGRDTGFVPVCATISIVAEAGTQEYELTWIKQ